MKTINVMYAYEIKDLRICNERTAHTLTEFMIMFYERNHVIDYFRDYDREKEQYFLRITTTFECDDFFKRFREMFPECKITKKTEVTTTTVENTEEVLG